MKEKRQMEILNMLQHITLGEWQYLAYTANYYAGFVTTVDGNIVCEVERHENSNGAFIAQAPKLVAELLDELLELQVVVGDFLVSQRFDEEAIKKLALAIGIDLDHRKPIGNLRDGTSDREEE